MNTIDKHLGKNAKDLVDLYAKLGHDFLNDAQVVGADISKAYSDISKIRSWTKKDVEKTRKLLEGSAVRKKIFNARSDTIRSILANSKAMRASVKRSLDHYRDLGGASLALELPKLLKKRSEEKTTKYLGDLINIYPQPGFWGGPVYEMILVKKIEPSLIQKNVASEERKAKGLVKEAVRKAAIECEKSAKFWKQVDEMIQKALRQNRKI